MTIRNGTKQALDFRPFKDDPMRRRLPSGRASKRFADDPTGSSRWRPELAEWCRRLALLGATDEMMADACGVSVDVFRRWKREKLALQFALRAKHMADANVANAMYQRATGYTFLAEKLFLHEGKVIRATITEHAPPDVGAGFKWLAARQGWSQRPDEVVQPTTVEGDTYNTLVFQGTGEELMKKYLQLMKGKALPPPKPKA